MQDRYLDPGIYGTIDYSNESPYLIRMRTLSFSLGIFLGAVSWAVVPLVSHEIEPFDSGLGFLIGQVTMSAAAFYFAISEGRKNILFYLSGIYIGMNLYAYAVGTPGTRSWAGLLLVTSLALCVFPVIFATAGKVTGVIIRRTRKSNPIN